MPSRPNTAPTQSRPFVVVVIVVVVVVVVVVVTAAAAADRIAFASWSSR
jgi:hypothetical protein